jgi:integration host factor subunit beta
MNGTMTKSDLIDVLCETQKIPKGRAELLVQVIFESMEVALKRGERIEIRGFGSFELRSYRPYEGRNPRTGVRVSVEPKRLPFFKVGKELKERVNAGKQAVTARPRDSSPAPVAVPAAMPAATTGPLTDSGATATAAAEPDPTGTPTRATA